MILYDDKADAIRKIMDSYCIDNSMQLSESIVPTLTHDPEHWTMFADPYVHLSLLRILNTNVMPECLQRYLVIKCIRKCSIMYVHNSHIASTLLEIMPYLAITLRAPTSRATRTRTTTGVTAMWQNLEMRYTISVQPTRGFYSTQSANIRTVHLETGTFLVLPQCTLLCDFLRKCEVTVVQPKCWGDYGHLWTTTEPSRYNIKKTTQDNKTKSVSTVQHKQVMETIQNNMTAFDQKIFLMRNIIPTEIVETAIKGIKECTDSELRYFTHIMFSQVNNTECQEEDDDTIQKTTHLMPRSTVLQASCDKPLIEQRVPKKTTIIRHSTFYHRLELLARLTFCSESYLAQHQAMTGPALPQLYLPIGREQLMQSIGGTVIERPAALPVDFSVYDTNTLTITIKQSHTVTLEPDLSFESIVNLLFPCIKQTCIVQHCNNNIEKYLFLIPRKIVLSEQSIQFIHLAIVIFIIRLCPIMLIDEVISIAVFVTTRLLYDNRTFHASLFTSVDDYRHKCLSEFWSAQSFMCGEYPERDVTKLLFRRDDRLRKKLITLDDPPRSGNHGNHRQGCHPIESENQPTRSDSCTYRAPRRVFWLNATDSSSYDATVHELQVVGLLNSKKRDQRKKKHPKVVAKRARICGRVRPNTQTLVVINERYRKKLMS